MRKPIILLVLLIIGGIQVAFAQITVSGKVFASADNSPMVGVSVQVKGTTTGIITDANGRYSLSVPDDQAVLVFSFIGYETEEVTVGGQTTIDISLEEAVTLVSEIVVTALGIKRDEKSLGYAVTVVKTDEMSKNKTINLMESLEGSVSGLNITPPAAGAGSSTQIRLRGQSAFEGANNAPLIVINGLPIDQGANGVNGAGAMRDLGDNMNSINPDDIETMTVLKGATAAAIYGSRAANGAIIITTKSGKKNQGIGVEYSGSLTTQKALNYMDDIQYVYGQGRFGTKPVSAADAAGTGQFGWGAKMDGELVPIFDGSMQPYSPNKDNLFKYYRTGKVWSNSLAFSGGNDKGSFRASFSNTDADGIDPYNEYKKNIANLGVNYSITERLNFSVNVNYTNEKFINPPEIGAQGPGAVNFFTRLSSSIPFSALENSATNPVTGTEAQTSGFQGTILNPIYAYGDAGQRYERTNDRYLGTATLRYDITEWLYAQGRFNYDYALTHTESKVPGGIGTSQPLNVSDGTYKGTYNVGEGWGTDINADFLVGATKTFNKLSVDASFGGNTFRVKNHSFNQTVTNFVVRDFFSIANGTNQTLSYDYDESRVNSLYGLAEFGYNSVFYLNFTGRQDWFSVLNPKNNSKFYSSVSGSIVFSEFLKNYEWLTFGKLRGSWAQVGSANGVNVYEGNLSYSIDNNAFNGQTLARIANTSSPNPNLQPFTVTEKEIGLDVRFFRNKLHLDIAAFDKLTTDQILSVQLSNASGFSSSKKNLGSLKNQGIETTIEYTPFDNSKFSWTSSWNNTYLKTEVLSVGVNSDGSKIEDLLVINFNGTGNEFLGELHYTVGKAMNMLYTRTYDRNENGDIIVKSNGRLQATPKYVPVGSSIPKFTGGWNNSFRYKNLTLGIFIDYKFGGKILSSTHLNLTRQGFTKLSLEGRRDGENGIVFPGVYDADPDPNVTNWQPNTTAVTDLQTFYGDYRNLQIGDPFVFKSDFVKLRNISISYDISNELNRLKFLGFIKGLVLTASCRNVAILYKDIINLDPEAIQSSGDMRAGYENASLPTTRNFMFSINAKF
ncbi:MAG: SusC/RagA family TonB-linked outer membrane protein [Bacteroidales bacterium]|nr:SusC/RagA family TonB-linked outer membrane protein [Bacteroidales bacterium]